MRSLILLGKKKKKLLSRQVILTYAKVYQLFFSNRLNCLLKDIASAHKHFLSYILGHDWLHHTPFELIFPEIFYIILSSQIFLCLPVWQMNVYLILETYLTLAISAFEQLTGHLSDFRA